MKAAEVSNHSIAIRHFFVINCNRRQSAADIFIIPPGEYLRQLSPRGAPTVIAFYQMANKPTTEPSVMLLWSNSCTVKIVLKLGTKKGQLNEAIL